MNVRTLMLMLSLGILAVPSMAHAGFADPLDTPATPSDLAPRGLFNGLAAVGDRIVAVGSRGHVLTSDDQGRHWAQASVPVSSDLTAVSFPTPKDGWAVGHDGVVLVSHDAGSTWQRQLDGRTLGPLLLRYYTEHTPSGLCQAAISRLQADARRFAEEGPDKPFLDVWFEDSQHGFIVGAFNLLLATTDGGASWIPWLDRTDNPKALHLYAVHSIGVDVYVTGEQGLAMKLDRLSGHFRALAVPYKGTLFGVTGNRSSVIVYGLRGNAFRSIDGGVHWDKLETSLPVSLTAGREIGNHQVLLLGQTGQVLRSIDDGATFFVDALDQRVPGSALLPLSDGKLLIAGTHGLHRVTAARTPGKQR
jgi:photosystem II stability/assembly factor-like uncharacterized protein